MSSGPGGNRFGPDVFRHSCDHGFDGCLSTVLKIGFVDSRLELLV